MTRLPLAGVRVLSLAEQWPGPFATLLLADLGADVILVERPSGGDPSRRFPGLFSAMNRNKRSVALDLKSDRGREDFLTLVDTADVVVEGFRPGAMDGLGLGADALRARKPSLVFVSILSFGQTGPRASVAGHDLSIQAAAGMIDVPSGEEAGFALPVLPLADISAAMFGALAVVTALFDRSRTGQGTQVDVSMLDSLIAWMAPFLVPPMNGLPIRPLPPKDPGYGLFGTADGRQITLSIAGEDHMWRALCRLLALPEFGELTEAQRSEHAADLDRVLRASIKRHPHDWLCQQLEAERIAFGPVNHVDEVAQDPQILARNMVVGFEGARFIRQPLVFDGVESKIVRPVPGLGQHTEEVLNSTRGESVFRLSTPD